MISSIYIIFLSIFPWALSKFQVGVMYPTEIIASATLLAMGPTRIWKVTKALWPFIPFTVYCIALCFFSEGGDISRLLRHSVLWVYPIIWSVIGWHVRDSSLDFWYLLIILLFAVQLVAGTIGMSTTSLVIGPLYCFVLALSLYQKQFFWPCLVCGFAITNSIFSGRMMDSRTTIVQAMLGIAYGTWLSSRQFGKFWAGIFTIFFPLVFFVMTLVPGALQNKNVDTSTKEGVLNVYKHADDGPTFKSQFRREAYKQAIKDWKRSPLFGVGFRQEVPSHMFGEPNGWNRSDAPPPISGPHNSYLTILARTGCVGLLLWLFIFFQFFEKIKAFVWGRDYSFYTRLAVVIVLNGLVLALFQVCFESPYYAAPFYFIVGSLWRHANDRRIYEL